MPSDAPAAQEAAASADDLYSRVTLGQVLDYFEADVLEVLTAPAGVQVAVGSTVLVGPGEPIAPNPDGILLAVGARPEDDTTTALLREAREAGYAAVVVKALGSPLDRLVTAAQDTGIALLRAAESMAWRHLDSLLHAAVPASGPVIEAFGAVGVGDLFALANAIAASVGGATTIEDPQGQVLAYSNLPNQEIDEIRREAILGRQTPDRPTNREEYQAVFRRGAVHRLRSTGEPEKGNFERIAIALWAGQRPLGLVWVISDHPPLGKEAELKLAEAAKVATLHLIRMQGGGDPQRWRRSESMRSALNGSLDRHTARADLGLGEEDASIVLSIVNAEAADGPVGTTVPARIVDLVTLLCESWDSRALCVELGGRVYALLPLTTGSDGSTEATDRIRRFASDLRATAQRSAGLDLLVGIGRPVTDVDDIARSRGWADHVALALQERGAATGLDGVAGIEDLRAAATLGALHAGGAAAGELTMPAVRDLIESETTGTGVPFGQTLLTYFGTMCDCAETGKILNIHENSVRYRVRRAQELHGLDFEDPDTLLVTWLQLRLALGPTG